MFIKDQFLVTFFRRKLILKIACIYLFLLSINGYSQKTKEKHLELKAKKGDGIYSFLRRYDMNIACARVDFLLENQLNINSILIKGKKYKLPILLLDTLKQNKKWKTNLDNKSIKQVLDYNSKMVYKGVKWKKNPSLWLPTNILSCNDAKSDMDDEEIELDIVKKKKNKVENKVINKSKVVGHFPILGEKYSSPPRLSSQLKGKIFYVLGGHGGPDPGAIAKVNGRLVTEDEYAYDVSLRLTRYLLSHGATVYVIVRDNDDGIRDSRYLKVDQDEVHHLNKKIPLQQKKRLRGRCDSINSLYDRNLKRGFKKQYLVSVHIDGRDKSKRIDLFFYHNPKSKQGKKLAQNMKNFIAQKYKEFQLGRGYSGSAKPRELYILRNTKPIGLFVEVGNLHNEFDRKRIFNPNNRDAVAKWLCEGLIANLK